MEVCLPYVGCDGIYRIRPVYEGVLWIVLVQAIVDLCNFVTYGTVSFGRETAAKRWIVCPEVNVL